ncbi:MAG TPA: T9SS type B sorting domain-containing protein, partial [Candidatus Saccharimonadales bacterium]
TLKRVDMVTIYSPPKAAFTYSPQPASIETPRVQFINNSTDIYGIAYQWWTFGDESDSTSNAINPVHTYHDTGTYCATLIVMNNGGCMDTVTNCLVIEPAFKLYIPSAFTPNGDGRNEVFQAVGQYVKSFEMYVFDRWGMELFHSISINQGWDGTYKGGISQEDVYVYKIIVIDSEDNQHSYVGNVTLLK